MHHAQRLEQEADSAWSCRLSKLTYIYIQRHLYKIDRIDRYIMFDLQQYSLKHATCTRLILSLVVDGIVYHAMEEDQAVLQWSSSGCSIKEKAGKINGSCGKRGCKSIINCVIFGLSREDLSSSWCTMYTRATTPWKGLPKLLSDPTLVILPCRWGFSRPSA